MYTGSFQFAQLEQSPHVRTAGRAFYHGSWGRPDPPKDTSGGDSDLPSTSSSFEESEGPAGEGPETESGGSEEDWEEEMEDGVHELDGPVGRDGREAMAVAEAKKKESKRRIAWGWPKKSDKTNKKNARETFSGGNYVDDTDARNGAARGSGDSNNEQERELKKRKEEKKEKPKKKKKKLKKKKHREQEKSTPHGEGYVEFLDGWGVSQVGNYKKLDYWFCWATLVLGRI